MGKCCVCKREGAYLAHGLWWCPEHYDMVDENPEEAQKLASKEKGVKPPPADLGLKWL